jgi:hypothetical protein
MGIFDFQRVTALQDDQSWKAVRKINFVYTFITTFNHLRNLLWEFRQEKGLQLISWIYVMVWAKDIC